MSDLKLLPETVIEYVANQISADSSEIESYGEREQTRTDHQRFIEKYLGFRLPTELDLQALGE